MTRTDASRLSAAGVGAISGVQRRELSSLSQNGKRQRNGAEDLGVQGVSHPEPIHHLLPKLRTRFFQHRQLNLLLGLAVLGSARLPEDTHKSRLLLSSKDSTMHAFNEGPSFCSGCGRTLADDKTTHLLNVSTDAGQLI
jgi:hypothetical protein